VGRHVKLGAMMPKTTKELLFAVTAVVVLNSVSFPTGSAASTPTPSKIPAGPNTEPPDPKKKSISDLMESLRQRLGKFDWDLSLFHDQDWKQQGYSVNNMPLIYWTCGDPSSTNTSLVLSSVHGDEVTPVYFGFRLVEWVKARPEICKNRFIIIAPLVNPDGFLRYANGTRTNWNKVDLNRNFSTPDWNAKAHLAWKVKGEGQRRYYPGDKAGSEPETGFQSWLIEEFKPGKILSVHSPLNVMDYDGPSHGEALKFSKAYIDSCEELKTVIRKATPDLKFFPYGNFPGSLGNFAGIQKGIPTLTAELPTADPKKAAAYFGSLEKGTRLFFEYALSGKPVRAHAADSP
jgi:murein peptide amidase A